MTGVPGLVADADNSDKIFEPPVNKVLPVSRDSLTALLGAYRLR